MSARFSRVWKNIFHRVEKSGRFFPYCGKTAEQFSMLWKTARLALGFQLVGALGAAGASPFTVTAVRAEFDSQPAVRVDFGVPAGHHLFASFTVADPQGNALEPFSLPGPDTHNPDDPEPSYSQPFTAFFIPPATDAIVVGYQGCKGELCFLPQEVTLTLGAAPASVENGGEPAATTGGFPFADRGEPRRLVGYADVPAFLAFLDPAAAPPAAASAWRLFLDDPAQSTCATASCRCCCWCCSAACCST